MTCSIWIKSVTNFKLSSSGGFVCFKYWLEVNKLSWNYSSSSHKILGLTGIREVICLKERTTAIGGPLLYSALFKCWLKVAESKRILLSVEVYLYFKVGFQLFVLQILIVFRWFSDVSWAHNTSHVSKQDCSSNWGLHASWYPNSTCNGNGRESWKRDFEGNFKYNSCWYPATFGTTISIY